MRSTNGRTERPRYSANLCASAAKVALRSFEAKQDYEGAAAIPRSRSGSAKCSPTLKSAQIERLIGQLVVLIAITVVTAGVGDLVVVGAAGWELGRW